MNKNELILQKQSEVTIHKYYKKYIQFMNIPFKMPEFQIKYKNITRNVFANIKEKDGEFILTVDPFLCKTKFAKPTLYHEFTHIYDHIIMNQLGIQQEYVYHVYTEYHASQIQMFAKLNAVTQFGTVDNNINHKSICDKLLSDKTDFSKRVSLLNLFTTKGFSKAVDLFCYYVGKVNVFLHYFSEYDNILLDLHEFINIFGDNIIPIQKALFQSDTTNISIDDIINIADELLELVKKFNPK